MASNKDNEEFKNAILSYYLLDDAIDWIANHIPMEDVYGEEMLVSWAESNGFIKKEE